MMEKRARVRRLFTANYLQRLNDSLGHLDSIFTASAIRASVTWLTGVRDEGHARAGFGLARSNGDKLSCILRGK